MRVGPPRHGLRLAERPPVTPGSYWSGARRGDKHDVTLGGVACGSRDGRREWGGGLGWGKGREGVELLLREFSREGRAGCDDFSHQKGVELSIMGRR